jgi:hypothetical protein
MKLLPREHGAYATLLFPLTTALIHARTAAAAWAWALITVLLFLAHEPLLVLLGTRGKRILQQHGQLARTRLAWLSLLIAACLLAAVQLGGLLSGANPSMWWAIAVPLVLGAALLPFTLKRLEKTLVGELLASAALCAASVPVAVAGSVSLRDAVVHAAVWLSGVTLGTLLVRSVTRRKRGREGRVLRVLTPLLALTLLAAGSAAVAAMLLPWWSVRALLPAGAICVALSLYTIPPTKLRRLGWALVFAHGGTWILLLPPFAQLS